VPARGALARFGAAAFGCLCCALTPATARAQQNNRVFVVVDSVSTSLVASLRAELASAGFRAEVFTPRTWPSGCAELEPLARGRGAAAGLIVNDMTGAVELCILDRSTGLTAFREAILADQHGGSTEVVAIRVVESLRAALLTVEKPRRAPAPPTPRASPVERASPPTAGRWAAALRGGGSYSPGGLGVGGQVGMAVSWALTPRVGVALDGVFSPRASTAGSTEGRATVVTVLVGPSLELGVSDPGGRLRVLAGVGAWLGLLAMKGDATPPFVAQRAEVLTLVPHADARLLLQLASHLAISAGLSVGFAAPKVAVSFAEREVATWGRPLVLGFVGLELTRD